jgi:hypothetical protein
LPGESIFECQTKIVTCKKVHAQRVKYLCHRAFPFWENGQSRAKILCMVFSGRSCGKKVRVVRRVRIHSKVSMRSSQAYMPASSGTPRVSATVCHVMCLRSKRAGALLGAWRLTPTPGLCVRPWSLCIVNALVLRRRGARHVGSCLGCGARPRPAKCLCRHWYCLHGLTADPGNIRTD